MGIYICFKVYVIEELSELCYSEEEESGEGGRRGGVGWGGLVISFRVVFLIRFLFFRRVILDF